MRTVDNLGVEIRRLLAELDRAEAKWLRRAFIQKLAEEQERLILGTDKKGPDGKDE